MEPLSRPYRTGVSLYCDHSIFFKEEVPESNGFIERVGHERLWSTLLYRPGRKKPLKHTAS